VRWIAPDGWVDRSRGRTDPERREDHVAEDRRSRAMEAALRVHTPDYLERLASACERGDMLDADTYTTRWSLDEALDASACGLAVLDEVLSGRARCGLSLVRPPGHHAEPGRAMGFCLVNHVAVLARAAQAAGVDRVAIIDWDVHHGNGTGAAFLADSSVLYASLHQWPLYPGTGWFTQRGTGQGNGVTLNVPLPPGSGDTAHLAAFDTLVAPRVATFAPGLILVSAGFDAHWRDPLATQRMTATGFHALGSRVAGLADALCSGRVVATLEGGYDLEAVAAGVAATVAALAGQPSPEDPLGEPPRPEDVDAALARIAAIEADWGR
jgi:acetoin utilization deacetylase AcuC-like enzyme